MTTTDTGATQAEVEALGAALMACAHARADAEAKVAAVIALCEVVSQWTRMDTREAGEVYNANTVDDFVTDLRAIAEGV